MPKTKDNKLKKTSACVLCKSDEDDELHFGKFFHSKELSVHNFCMLFSSDLSQNGKDDNDGFAGFLPKDIRKEVVRGRRLKCSYCKKNGATIGCCVPACKKVFHLNCGLKHNSLHLFFDSFLSYCSLHKAKPIYPEGEPLTNKFTCSICCDTVYLKDYDTTIWASCCKNGWFHKPCIQRQAHNAGYFFRCPLCNNTEQFQKQMLHHGIYIPQQDAAWELEENAFQELLYRHEQCDASHCICPKGRKHHTKSSQWRLTLCKDCGSQGRHIGCDDTITRKGIWKCQSCVEVNEKMKAKKESECSNNKVKKIKSICKPDTPQESIVRALRSSVRKNSTENSSSTKDEILATSGGSPSIKGEILPASERYFIKDEIPSISEQKRNGASRAALRGGAVSFNTESTYKITKISKRGEEDLSKIRGNSAPLNIQSETKVPLDINLEFLQCTESFNLDHENAIDLFSDVAASVPESDLEFSPCKSEIFQGDTTELDKVLPNSSPICDSLNKCKEVNSISTGNSSASHLLHGHSSVDLEPEVSKLLPIQNKSYLLQANSAIIEAEDSNATTVASYDVDRENLLSQNVTPVDILYNTNVGKELSDVSTVEDDSLDFSFSPDTVKNTYKMHRKHSKRICVDVEDNPRKKQKLNNLSGQSHNSVMILNLVQNMQQTIGIEHKYFVNSSSKTVNEILSPTSSSDFMDCYSQKIDEEHGNEAFNVKNILGNSKTPVVKKIHDDLGHNGERDREPLVKLFAVRNRLAKKRVKTRRAEGDCETSHNSANCSDSYISENKSVKKQKLHMLSKKNCNASLRCKDSYRCIKALLGGPCRCCENKAKHTKDLSTKSKSSKKCSQNCRPQYNIECIGKRPEEMSLGSKHSCNRPTNYIVNFWQPGRQMSTISETKEKLSVKPQVIHLKTVPH